MITSKLYNSTSHRRFVHELIIFAFCAHIRRIPFLIFPAIIHILTQAHSRIRTSMAMLTYHPCIHPFFSVTRVSARTAHASTGQPRAICIDKRIFSLAVVSVNRKRLEHFDKSTTTTTTTNNGRNDRLL